MTIIGNDSQALDAPPNAVETIQLNNLTADTTENPDDYIPTTGMEVAYRWEVRVLNEGLPFSGQAALEVTTLEDDPQSDPQIAGLNQIYETTTDDVIDEFGASATMTTHIYSGTIFKLDAGTQYSITGVITRGTGASEYGFNASATFATPVVIPSITLEEPNLDVGTWECDIEFMITNWGLDTDNWQHVTDNDLEFSQVKLEVSGGSSGSQLPPEFIVDPRDYTGGRRTYIIDGNGEWQQDGSSSSSEIRFVFKIKPLLGDGTSYHLKANSVYDFTITHERAIKNSGGTVPDFLSDDNKLVVVLELTETKDLNTPSSGRSIVVDGQTRTGTYVINDNDNVPPPNPTSFSFSLRYQRNSHAYDEAEGMAAHHFSYDYEGFTSQNIHDIFEDLISQTPLEKEYGTITPLDEDTIYKVKVSVLNGDSDNVVNDQGQGVEVTIEAETDSFGYAVLPGCSPSSKSPLEDALINDNDSITQDMLQREENWEVHFPDVNHLELMKSHAISSYFDFTFNSQQNKYVFDPSNSETADIQEYKFLVFRMSPADGKIVRGFTIEITGLSQPPPHDDDECQDLLLQCKFVENLTENARQSKWMNFNKPIVPNASVMHTENVPCCKVRQSQLINGTLTRKVSLLGDYAASPKVYIRIGMKNGWEFSSISPMSYDDV